VLPPEGHKIHATNANPAFLHARALRHALCEVVGMESTLPSSAAASPVDGQTAPTAPPSGQSRARRALRVLLAGALLLAVGYGAGRLHGWVILHHHLTAERNAAMNAESARRQELSRASELLDQLRTQRMEVGVLVELQDGYRYTQLALDALDARNFGTAESHLRAAERTLQPPSAAVPGLQDQLMRLSGLHVAVASDLGQQRAAVRDIAIALNSLIDARRAESPAQVAQP
jgi:hypothetical protein